MHKEKNIKIITATTAGFCLGVNLALKKLDALILRNATEQTKNKIIMLGPIIHNPLVMHDYAEQGVLCLTSIDAIKKNDHVIVRAHGIPQEVEKSLRKKGAIITDATCPKVKKAQLRIAKQASLHKTLLLFGEAEHPEVQGLVSYATSGAHIFNSLDELQQLSLSSQKEYFLAAQTTQDNLIFKKIAQYVHTQFTSRIIVLETICDATHERQNEAVRLAKKTDCMIVVGGKNSGNTRRLAEISVAQGTPTFHVESATEISYETIAPYALVGITAGASTPDAHIEAMQHHIQQLMVN